eukprot:Gregarina_sp_Poly_1__1086@NODE_1266_length_4566_cov_27_360302_g861_i0_p3_GENE_NODE_1266_length_4566_cov_27_360302_g861_i0NODE_1266_length_4566_cov_27_360302_g861_i0_p3_ORF_typecomplete_len152_score10_69HTH_51/PF18558_1/0_21_NODE_1266_length_4566_cov_27_360302_g861_i034433898
MNRASGLDKPKVMLHSINSKKFLGLREGLAFGMGLSFTLVISHHAFINCRCSSLRETSSAVLYSNPEPPASQTAANEANALLNLWAKTHTKITKRFSRMILQTSRFEGFHRLTFRNSQSLSLHPINAMIHEIHCRMKSIKIGTRIQQIPAV